MLALVIHEHTLTIVLIILAIIALILWIFGRL